MTNQVKVKKFTTAKLLKLIKVKENSPTIIHLMWNELDHSKL